MTDKRQNIRDLLVQQSLLEYVPPVEIDRLAAAASTVTYEPEQPIFRKGDLGSSVMSILSGRVRISTYSAEGRAVTLAIMGPREILGEIAMIDGGSRIADAVTLEPTELLVIGRDEFLSFLERTPQACLRLLEILCERFRWTDETVIDLNIFNLRPRLAKRLLTLADQYGEQAADSIRVAIRVPAKTLAGMMGSTPEAVARQLRSWTEAGYIDLEPDGVVIRDRDALARAVLKLSALTEDG